MNTSITITDAVTTNLVILIPNNGMGKADMGDILEAQLKAEKVITL